MSEQKFLSLLGKVILLFCVGIVFVELATGIGKTIPAATYTIAHAVIGAFFFTLPIVLSYIVGYSDGLSVEGDD